MSNAYHLHIEAEAAARLRQRLIAEYGDEDAALLKDMVEGETNLRWLMEKATLELAVVEGMADGVSQALAKMKERKEKLEARCERLRSALFEAMDASGHKTFKAAAGTLSVRQGRPKVEIIDPAAVPDAFKIPQEPVISKTLIKEALDAGQHVSGATLSNAAPVLSIRFT